MADKEGGACEDDVEAMDTECGVAVGETKAVHNGDTALFIPAQQLQRETAVEEARSCVGRKRLREGGEELGRGGGGEREVEKRGCEEGMSWWTCLMLGMDQENTKPRVVRKVHTPQS